MSDTSSKSLNLKFWHAALILVVLLVVFGFTVARLINNAPARPIAVDSHNLSTVQAKNIEEIAQSFGDVQFFNADLTAIHQAVSQLAWVERVSVVRDWYQGVLISVTPRQAVANFGSDRLIDTNAVVYVPADSQELMNKKLVNLYGEDVQSHQIMQKMQRINEWYAPLGLTARDLILTPRQTWVVRFENGLRVIVDYENTDQKLYMLATLLGSNFKSDISKIQSVDLRYKNGFAIAWKSQSADKT
ncbi:cell division protein FtsQ/DivIB [Moraxella nasovis]|uniref:cell division protein FtsQ/DivIB n=1 Tax=Moraxella nasovis TaxID=2904121 RepID=UPI001F623FB4|nr:cell division protein FtsQ/DivIB [Moraxella nasovis]UNU73766.1 cell division protein FtsQ/DivIB [Moraxella nasovis]